jgi:hypothetical protein
MTSRPLARAERLRQPLRRAALAALTAHLVALGGALALVATTACSGPDVRAPNPTRPLDERRAIEVIRRAMRGEGVDAIEGRDVKIQPSGKTLHVDVGVQGREYGIAYITQDDMHELKDAIPPPNKKDERLRILRAGDDGETRIVVLYQDNYLYDDLVGEGHEQTTIQVEGQLTRDVQDFLVHAKTQRYK